MEWFKEIFNQVSTLFKWWIIVLPWEKGLRIRIGKRIKKLDSGIHFRIPYFDSVYVQPFRLMFINLSPQTLTNRSGETITLSLIVGYSINDISELYNSVSELESAVSGKVMGSASQYVSSSIKEECTPKKIEQSVISELDSHKWGLKISQVTVSSFAITKTYRLIQDPNWLSTGRPLDAKR